MTEVSSLFLRFRIVAFSCVNFFSFLWIILESIVIFSQWDDMNKYERSLVSVMLIVNVITVVMLLVLLLVQFRVWLDMARISLLLTAQIGEYHLTAESERGSLYLNPGSAGAFALWKPQFNCEEKSGDEEGICDILTICIMVTSWIVPALLLIYLVGLAYRSFRRRVGRVCIASDAESRDTLPEGTYPKKSHLSTVFPAPLAFPPEVCNRQSVSVNSRRITMPTTASKAPSLPTSLFTPGSPARLSKRSPSAYNL